MTRPNCEIVCMSAMALEEGGVSELSAEQIEVHLADCSDCRREGQQMRSFASFLDGQKRKQQTEDVWMQVEQRLPHALPTPSASRVGYSFVILGLLLLGYRLIEMISDRHFGLLFRLVPILLVMIAFSYVRENPFTINSELTLEGA